MVVVRQISPRRVGLGVVAWADRRRASACSSAGRTTTSASRASLSDTAILFAGVLTAAVGFWLGWSHRTGTAFVAPFLAWIVVVPFAFASEFIRYGFFGGLWHGFVLAIVSAALVAAFVEGVLLVSFAVLGRISAAALGTTTTARR